MNQAVYNYYVDRAKSLESAIRWWKLWKIALQRFDETHQFEDWSSVLLGGIPWNHGDRRKKIELKLQKAESRLWNSL